MYHAWLFFLPPVVIAALVIAAWVAHKVNSKNRDLKRVAVLAHTSTVKKLPAYRKAARQYRIMLIAAAASFVISVFSFTAVIARPFSRQVYNSQNENRDIILCLDVSGSMRKYQKDILKTLSDIASKMHGQRIGITIFDGVPANLFPPSDDYDALAELIDELSDEEKFGTYNYSVLGSASSLIGDGVMGCINSFDKLEDEERSKTIIVATDNYAGPETVDINQAARYAKRYGIVFYGISINGYKSRNQALFQNAVELTGGAFYDVADASEKDANAANSIVHNIFDQEAAKVAGADEIITRDSPELALIIATISFTVFISLIWRLRL